MQNDSFQRWRNLWRANMIANLIAYWTSKLNIHDRFSGVDAAKQKLQTVCENTTYGRSNIGTQLRCGGPLQSFEIYINIHEDMLTIKYCSFPTREILLFQKKVSQHKMKYEGAFLWNLDCMVATPKTTRKDFTIFRNNWLASKNGMWVVNIKLQQTTNLPPICCI